jgi:hypothetical protein
VKKILSKEIM